MTALKSWCISAISPKPATTARAIRRKLKNSYVVHDCLTQVCMCLLSIWMDLLNHDRKCSFQKHIMQRNSKVNGTEKNRSYQECQARCILSVSDLQHKGYFQFVTKMKVIVKSVKLYWSD